jgi:S1-C subfamily serine protease
MRNRWISMTLIVAMAALPLRVTAQPARSESNGSDASAALLEQGIRQTRLGDFNEAIVTLRRAVQRFKVEPNRVGELARAYIYLSICHLELGNETAAKKAFQEAVATGEELKLTEEEYPRRFLRFFENTRQDWKRESRSQGGGPALRARDIARRALPGTVSIRCKDSLGSGFFVAEELLLTNAHVVCTDRDSLRVVFEDGRTMWGEVQRVRDDVDLALIKVVGAGARGLSLGDAGAIAVGDRVVIIGNPLGLDFTVHDGGVSNITRIVNRTAYLQLDSDLNPGNSGGPVIDDRGRVIGIVTLKVSAADGIAMALPINYAYHGEDALIAPTSGAAESEGFAVMLARAESQPVSPDEESPPAQDTETEEVEVSDPGGNLPNYLLIGGFGVIGAGATVKLLGGLLSESKTAPATFNASIDSNGSHNYPIAGATVVTFRGEAHYAEGDPLTYGWDFRDGTKATGKTVTHIFTSAGTFMVMLTISDGKATDTVSKEIEVISLTGRWRDEGTDLELTLTQQGAALNGVCTYSFSGGGVIEGILTDPRDISMTLTFGGQLHRFIGAVSSSGRSFSGRLDGEGEMFSRIQ